MARNRNGRKSVRVTRKPQRRQQRKQPVKRVQSKRAAPVRTSTISRKKLAALFTKQKAAAAVKRIERQAKDAVRKFKVRKADRGRVLMIGVHGQRNPQTKGRKGYTIIVSKTGKKKLLKQFGETVARPHKISDINLPKTRATKKAVTEFQRARLQKVGRGTAVKAKGETSGRKGSDFSAGVITKLTDSIEKVMRGQRSRREFLITVNVLVKLPDGSTKVIQSQVPIARPDHIAIKYAGLQNFVERKLYAFMARELAYLGYVSSGSANHISRLPDNYGVRRSRWVDKDGEEWRGADKTEVTITKIEWQIEQIKR